jgi:cytochrome c oxidase cbb3-type subunit 3
MVEKISHSVDGIEEYDNPIPRWLMVLLYGSIVFAVVYLILYPGFWAGTTGWTQAKMYEEEMARAEVMYAGAKDKPVDAASYIGNAMAIEEGKDIFAQNCMPCHGAMAMGDTGIGPNLTDAEWRYGSANATDVANTISNGTELGMPPFGSQLSADKVAKVTAFVLSLGPK